MAAYRKSASLKIFFFKIQCQSVVGPASIYSVSGKKR